MRDVNELKQHLIETWSATSRASLVKRLISGEIVLMHVSKLKANTEHLFAICFSVTIMTLKRITAVMNIDLRLERWALLLQAYFSICVPKIIENYNIMWFGKVIAKNMEK